MLSRRRAPDEPPLMVVVDEAHHFRNRGTNRRNTLASKADAPMLLLTATPVTNTLDDLWALFELFLADHDVQSMFGWNLATARRLAEDGHWDPVELLRELTVRRVAPPDSVGFGSRPSAHLEIVPYQPSAEEQWLWANLERELRSLTLFDDAEDWPKPLFIEHVLRRWESGPHALLQTLSDLHDYAERKLEAALVGRQLDRAGFREIFGAAPQQHVFPFVYAVASSPDPVGPIALREAVHDLAGLRTRAEVVCEAGLGRDEVILGLARDGKLLIFTSYRRAAEGLYELLVTQLGPSARVGLITGSQARATGLGRVPASEVLRRFSPGSHATTLRPHETLQALVATDCVSEGVNLQDCGRVVLADLPYTPVAIEQRVGRLLRPGGPHDHVSVYLPRPVNWVDSLGMRRRLSEKVGAARGAGVQPSEVLCGGGFNPFDTLTTLEHSALMASSASDPSLPPAAKLVADPDAWLVLATIGDRPWLFAVSEVQIGPVLRDLAWSSEQLTRCAVPVQVRDALQRRSRLLRASLAAPAPLELDAPEVAAWRQLIDAAGVLRLTDEQLAELRERLLQRQRLGVRRQLATLVSANSAPRLLRYVGRLSKPRTEAPVSLVSCLGVRVEQGGKSGV
jgi:hypothetical protein